VSLAKTFEGALEQFFPTAYLSRPAMGSRVSGHHKITRVEQQNLRLIIPL